MGGWPFGSFVGSFWNPNLSEFGEIALQKSNKFRECFWIQFFVIFGVVLEPFWNPKIINFSKNGASGAPCAADWLLEGVLGRLGALWGSEMETTLVYKWQTVRKNLLNLAVVEAFV